MDHFQDLYFTLKGVWRGLFPGALERSVATALFFVVAVYLIVFAIEKAYGTRTNNYRSRDFMHDLAYYFYYRTGVQRLLLTGPLFLALDAPLSFLDLKLLAPLPFAVQVVLWLLIGDLVMYWLHRAQHHYRFLWAFHSTHHAEERLTFASYLRFHPVEVLLGECLAFVVLRILGFNLNSWFLAYLLTNFLGEIQHTRIPWKLGPLYKVIVTPTFHSYHHSREKAVHDRNFGGLFSFWDYLFGTAVPDTAVPPKQFGLAEVQATSLLSTLVTPFRLLHEFYFRGPSHGSAPLDPKGREATRL